MLGITFKENCPDIRNTKAIDVYTELQSYGVDLTLHDPWASAEEVKHEYGIPVIRELPNEKYDAVVLTVAHEEYKKLKIADLKKNNAIVYDVKAFFNKVDVDGRL
jgi:UDP-N-acetyl-D-galactosamine dehydrogenase